MRKQETLSTFMAKVEAALSEDEKTVSVMRVTGNASEGTEQSEELEEVSREILKSKPGTYRLFDSNGVQIGRDLVIGPNGGTVTSSPDPVVTGARAMAMFAEGWRSLTDSQTNVIKEARERAERLEVRNDELKEENFELKRRIKELEDGDGNTELYNQGFMLVQQGLTAWMNRDERQSLVKFAKLIIPKIKDEATQKELADLVNQELKGGPVKLPEKPEATE